MAKRIVGLADDGKLVLKLPGGKSEPLPEQMLARSFLVIDCSTSMSGAKLTQAIAGALSFAADAIKRKYTVGLVSFASAAELLCLPEDSFSVLSSRAERLNASGSTNMKAGIEKAAAELVKSAGLRVIVIVTDGMPDSPELALAAANKAKESGIDIIAIGTDDADQMFLQKIASRSELAVNVPSARLQSGIAGAAKMLPAATRAR